MKKIFLTLLGCSSTKHLDQTQKEARVNKIEGITAITLSLLIIVVAFIKK